MIDPDKQDLEGDAASAEGGGGHARGDGAGGGRGGVAEVCIACVVCMDAGMFVCVYDVGLVRQFGSLVQACRHAGMHRYTWRC